MMQQERKESHVAARKKRKEEKEEGRKLRLMVQSRPTVGLDLAGH
jgi:hypothetical protein